MPQQKLNSKINNNKIGENETKNNNSISFKVFKALKDINNNFGNIIIIIVTIIGAYVAISALKENRISRTVSGLPYLQLEREEEEDIDNVIQYRMCIDISQKDKETKTLEAVYKLTNYGNGTASEVSFERFAEIKDFNINSIKKEGTVELSDNLIKDSMLMDIYAPYIYGEIIIPPGGKEYIKFQFVFNKDQLTHLYKNIYELDKKCLFDISYMSIVDRVHRLYRLVLTPVVEIDDQENIIGFNIHQSFRDEQKKFKY